MGLAGRKIARRFNAILRYALNAGDVSITYQVLRHSATRRRGEGDMAWWQLRITISHENRLYHSAR